MDERKVLIILVAAIVTIVLALGFLMWAIVDCLNTVNYEKQRKKMYKSLGNILLSYYRGENTARCFEEISILFKHIIYRNEELKRNYTSVDFLLEKYLIELNSGDEKISNFGIEEINTMKEYILRLINEFKKNNPIAQIKGANNVLLNNIIQYFQHDERDKFDEAINQLAIEMKSLQDNLFEKGINSKKQDTLAKVGLILSIVFGIMTFIQFFV